MSLDVYEGQKVQLAAPCQCGSPLGTVEHWDEVGGRSTVWIILCCGSHCHAMWELKPQVEITPLAGGQPVHATYAQRD